MKNIAISIAIIAAIAVGIWVFQRNKPSPMKPIPPSALGAAHPKMHFVFAKILDPIMPIERGEKYEGPLDKMLHEQNIGEVTGGGTMQRKDKSIEYVGVDIELA